MRTKVSRFAEYEKKDAQWKRNSVGGAYRFGLGVLLVQRLVLPSDSEIHAVDVRGVSGLIDEPSVAVRALAPFPLFDAVFPHEVVAFAPFLAVSVGSR